MLKKYKNYRKYFMWIFDDQVRPTAILNLIVLDLMVKSDLIALSLVVILDPIALSLAIKPDLKHLSLISISDSIALGLVIIPWLNTLQQLLK